MTRENINNTLGRSFSPRLQDGGAFGRVAASLYQSILSVQQSRSGTTIATDGKEERRGDCKGWMECWVVVWSRRSSGGEEDKDRRKEGEKEETIKGMKNNHVLIAVLWLNKKYTEIMLRTRLFKQWWTHLCQSVFCTFTDRVHMTKCTNTHTRARGQRIEAT